MKDSKNDLFGYLSLLVEKGKDVTLFEEDVYEKFGKELAVVCIDSTGFSRTVKKKGVVYYLSLIARMRKLVVEAVIKNGAVSFRRHADNIFAEFETVDEAFIAVVEANRAVRGAGLMLYDEERFKICSGIGYGQVLFSEAEGPYGDEMNLASKLGEDTAEGEEILLTENAFKRVSGEIKGDFKEMKITISGLNENYYKTEFSAI